MTEVYHVIAKESTHFAVAALCHTLGVSRSGYYAWCQRRPQVDAATPLVRQVFRQHSRRYGVRRIVAELQASGHRYGRRRVRRIMQAEGLRAIQPNSFVPRTTDSQHGARMSPNLLPGLSVARPHQVFVSDITYLPLTGGRWAYLATWLDLYSRRITGWQIAETMTAELVIGALRRAIGRWRPARGLILHSDRGGQYVDTAFRQLLAACGYRQSMSRAGETYDNAFAESLFSRYKAELLEDGVFRDVSEAQMETCEHIERYYNPVRRPSALGYVSPEEYERAYYQRAKAQNLAAQERTAS